MMSSQSRQCCRVTEEESIKGLQTCHSKSRTSEKGERAWLDQCSIGAQAFAALGHAYGAACVEDEDFLFHGHHRVV